MDFVEQVKSSVDIVKVIGEHVRLKKMGGSGRYQGLCPFHQEKTPSFSVHQSHQYYKCFGCGVGGDVFKFVQEIERISFFEALKLLAERNGIPMPKRNEYSDPESKLRNALLDMHEIAAQLFRQNLNGPAGSDARAYLAKRGVTPALAEEFSLGMSADSWDQLTRRFQDERYTPEQLEASGLVTKRQEGSGFYDRFHGRLMFPIHNESGKVIGFGGRALKAGEEPKYLNSPETSVYRKSFVLYNLHRAKDAMRKLEQVILVEGYMDVLGVYSAGVCEVVASCGTSLTNTQVRAIKKHTDHIIVNFDPDTAGANASERYIQMLLEEGMRVRVLELEGGLDPDEYVKQNGAEAYREKLKHASGYFHWLADRTRGKFDMNSSEGRIEGLKFLMPAIQKVHDKLERATIAGEVASYLGIDRGLVLDQFRKNAANGSAAQPVRPAVPLLPGYEKVLLNALLISPEARTGVLPSILELAIFAKLTTKTILETVAVLSAEGASFSFLELEQRLDSRNRDLLASVAFADEVSDESLALEQAKGCLRALEAQNREMEVGAYRDLIRVAERSGDFPKAMRLTTELNELFLKRKR
jgi:DNA primase